MSGGFIPESDSQIANSPAKGRGGSSAQGVRACTIKQLQESETNSEGRLEIDKQEVSQFQLVCCVRAVKEISTGTDYLVEDGTSSINARCWPDKNVGPVREGDWVHIVGSFKALGQSKSVTVLAMKKITDFNQVTYHFLEAMTAHKIAIDPSFLKSSNGANKQSKLESNSASMGSYEDQSLTPLQRLVFSYYRESQDEIGVNINSIINSLRSRYSESDVKNAVNGLLTEGLIYMTIDSDHARNLSA